MKLSVHDNKVISYEVQCQQRSITLRTEYLAEKKPTELTNVVFSGVQYYHFQNDAFGNIIFDVIEMPIDQFLKEYALEMSELYRMNGSPVWAKDTVLIPLRLQELAIKAFVLSSSLGLYGWVLANEMSIVSPE